MLPELLQQFGQERRSEFDLRAFRKALKAAGDPEQVVPSFVVAGTNGKGTAALKLSAGIMAGGFSVMTYLSPHLVSPYERFLSNLVTISPTLLDGIAKSSFDLAQKFQLSYFEFLTLVQFLSARELRPNFLVLEVDLGGRLDATNVTQPRACLLTNISFDHMDVLGNTLEKILLEKLGVCRPGVPLYTSLEPGPLLDLVREKHDNVNQAADLVRTCLNSEFPEISNKTIDSAFNRVINPGRFEILQVNPRIIVSGDHNPAGIEWLAQKLKEHKIERPKILCAFGPDKPREKMLERLKELGEVTETQIRSEDAETKLERIVSTLKKDETLVVTGSLYLVGQLRPLLTREPVRFLKTI